MMVPIRATQPPVGAAGGYVCWCMGKSTYMPLLVQALVTVLVVLVKHVLRYARYASAQVPHGCQARDTGAVLAGTVCLQVLILFFHEQHGLSLQRLHVTQHQ